VAIRLVMMDSGRSASKRSGAPNAARRPFGLDGVFPPLMGIVGAGLIWQFAVVSGLLDRTVIPTATETLSTMIVELKSSSTWLAIYETLKGWAIALVLASILAIPAGILIGANRLLYEVTRPVVEFLRPVPSVALIPLAVLVFGSGLESKVFLATFAAIWMLLIQTIYGVHDVNPVAYDTSRAYGLGAVERLYRISLPSALPFIATGLRVASTVALLLVVSTEIVIGAPGIGRAIMLASSAGAYRETYALVMITGFLGIGLNLLHRAVERYFLQWHPAYRRAAR
jgi:ABC-type nitrate/sulfonate/bicarbonate transport system permease component